MTLREQELYSYVENIVPILDDENKKTQWKKNYNRAMKILEGSVKDHIDPIISKLDTTHDMFTFLENMYEIKKY